LGGGEDGADCKQHCQHLTTFRTSTVTLTVTFTDQFNGTVEQSEFYCD